MTKFSINVLCYGNHSQLAKRCLGSMHEFMDPSVVSDLRVGFNEVSDATRQVVEKLCGDFPVPCYLFEHVEHKNVFKYPLMRYMFYSDDIDSDDISHFMWFDDDSFIKTGKNGEEILRLAKLADDNDLLGSMYTIPVVGNQRTWIEQQPWYTGKAVPSKLTFVTGGWWIARKSLLEQWNYPWPELLHNGGDRMLGELARQQNWVITEYRSTVAINADADCRESKAKRRGYSERPLGYDLKPPTDIQPLDIRITRLN